MRHVNFKDAGGMKCQVSVCSSSEPLIWVGARDPGEKGLGLGKARRMLLTQEGARELGHLLLRFYNLGELIPGGAICAVGKKKPSPKG